MDFSLTDEQAMLRESIEQFVSKTYSFDERRRHSAQKNGFSPEVWQQFAELGWLAIPFSENDGGFDGGPIELMLIMQEFGKGLVVEPYLASIVLAGGAIRRCDNADLKKRLLPGLIEGQLQAALAFAEAGAGYELDNITTTAEETTDGYRISGEKIAVLNAAAADCILVSAITAADGVCLFCLPADAPGVSCRAYPTVDGLHAADLTLKNVPVDADRLLTSKDGGINLLQATIDDATLAVCAEAVGIMQMLNTRTVDYCKTREQFGVPLSSFQALQHRMVDMFTDFEMTRSLLLMAAIKSAEQSADASRSIAALKYQVGTAGRKLGQEAVQLHGGMGVTDELDVAHYFKRLTTIDLLFGNADFQLGRFADLGNT